MQMDKKQVMEFLPHRDPFLFIDSLKGTILPEALAGREGPFKTQELIGATSICTFKVDSSVKVLEGHFPGFPILPGVVQIEMMAQAASFLAIYTLEKPIAESKLDVQLISVESAKFRKPVLPPMDLEIRAKLIKVRGPIQMYECELHSNGELIAQTTVMASLKITYK